MRAVLSGKLNKNKNDRAIFAALVVTAFISVRPILFPVTRQRERKATRLSLPKPFEPRRAADQLEAVPAEVDLQKTSSIIFALLVHVPPNLYLSLPDRYRRRFYHPYLPI